jgi:hypothetical protein
MMQAADFGNRDDHAEVRRLDSPSVGCVLVEREVSASPMDGSTGNREPTDHTVEVVTADRAETASGRTKTGRLGVRPPSPVLALAGDPGERRQRGIGEAHTV